MGTQSRSIRGTFSAAIVVLVAAATLSLLTLNASAQRAVQHCLTKNQSGPDTPGRCKPLRQCDFFWNILNKVNLTEPERSLLRENRCNAENPNVHVCCPMRLGSHHRSNPDEQQSTEGLAPLAHPLLPRECGIANWQRSNGSVAQIDEYPWLVLIELQNDKNEKMHGCAGVLISDRYVLTAGHCASQLAWNISAIRLGEWQTDTNPDCMKLANGATQCAPAYQDIRVEQVLVHNLYKRSANPINDIALVRLEQPALISQYVKPICLPNKQIRADELEGLIVESAGWQFRTSPKKNKGEVRISSMENCQSSYSQANLQLQTTQLCGESTTDERQANSGGPLMLYKNNAYILGGLLSFGPTPAPKSGWPDVYTRVASFIDWIHTNLKA